MKPAASRYLGCWLSDLGRRLHIVIDVPTYSANYFPSPVLDPISCAAFGGVERNRPSFMVLNYVTPAFSSLWWPHGGRHWIQDQRRNASTESVGPELKQMLACGAVRSDQHGGRSCG